MKPEYRAQNGKQAGVLLHAIGTTTRILEIILNNPNITYRQIAARTKLRYETLSKYLIDMRELSLIERTQEIVHEESQLRGLVPRYVNHYQITNLGVQFLSQLGTQLSQ